MYLVEIRETIFFRHVLFCFKVQEVSVGVNKSDSYQIIQLIDAYYVDMSINTPVPYLTKAIVVFRGSLDFQKQSYFDQSITSKTVKRFFLSSTNNILIPQSSLMRKGAPNSIHISLRIAVSTQK